MEWILFLSARSGGVSEVLGIKVILRKSYFLFTDTLFFSHALLLSRCSVPPKEKKGEAKLFYYNKVMFCLKIGLIVWLLMGIHHRKPRIIDGTLLMLWKYFTDCICEQVLLQSVSMWSGVPVCP